MNKKETLNNLSKDLNDLISFVNVSIVSNFEKLRNETIDAFNHNEIIGIIKKFERECDKNSQTPEFKQYINEIILKSENFNDFILNLEKESLNEEIEASIDETIFAIQTEIFNVKQRIFLNKTMIYLQKKQFNDIELLSEQSNSRFISIPNQYFTSETIDLLKNGNLIKQTSLTNEMLKCQVLRSRIIQTKREDFDQVDEILLDIESLTLVDLSERNLISIDKNLFDGFVSLKTIDLKNNDLEHLNPALFYGLNNLEDINLSSNIISMIEADLFNGLPKLNTINLSFNQIIHLNGNLFTSLPNIELIILCNNRLEGENRRLFEFLPILWE